MRAIDSFVPTAAQSVQARAIDRRSSVTDGRLTVDAVGGTNTKLTYVEIAAAVDSGAVGPAG